MGENNIVMDFLVDVMVDSWSWVHNLVMRNGVLDWQNDIMVRNRVLDWQNNIMMDSWSRVSTFMEHRWRRVNNCVMGGCWLRMLTFVVEMRSWMNYWCMGSCFVMNGWMRRNNFVMD